MRLLLALAPIAMLVIPASAGETPWQEVAPGVKLRLISSGLVKPDGTTLVGLEIDMPQTTKTYWRVPGDTGFPAELDFSASTGVTSHRIVWPYPKRDETENYLDYVYYGPLVLPIEVSVDGATAQAEIDAMLGICSDICLPAQANFSLPLGDAQPDRANGLRIKQALAMAPIAWEEGAEPIGDVAIDADAAMLEVELTDPALDPATLIAATESGEPVFGTPQKSPQADLVLIPVLGKASATELENQDIQLTFMTGMGAFEVVRTVSGDPAD